MFDVDSTGNTATSVGSLEFCASIAVGDTTTVDLVVAPIGIPSDRPIIGFQAATQYDPGILQFQSADLNLLLASQPGSQIFDASDGAFLIAALDVGETAGGGYPSESGPGVLARLTFTALAPGTTAIGFDVTATAFVDESNQELFAEHYVPALIAVESPGACTDSDADGHADSADNCPANGNPNQADFDHDAIGDVCDPDIDSDGVANELDLCPRTESYPSLGVDAGGCSQLDVDRDWDGICNPGAPSTGPRDCSGSDNCPDNRNTGQGDLDGDGLGDVCDPDADADGIPHAIELQYGSSDRNALSTPEAWDYQPFSCSDAADNDLDGYADSADDRCPPANDDFANAKVIGELPFADTTFFSEATNEKDEPGACSSGSSTVWYRFTAASDGGILVVPHGYPAALGGAFTGTALDSLTLVACNTAPGISFVVSVAAGQTIYLRFSGSPVNGYGSLSLSILPDLDSDGRSDLSDNCPSAPNPTQTDSDGDNVGDACDPTPTHDLAITKLSTSSPVLERGQTGALNLSIKVRNNRPYTDVVVFSLHFFTLPNGCSPVGTRGQPATVGAARVTTVTLHLTIYCLSSTSPGTYYPTLTTTVYPFPGSGDLNPADNRWTSTTAIEVR